MTAGRPASGRAEPLERLLSKWRVASRTVAAAWVREGRVQVDGRPARDPRLLVDPRRARVVVDGRAVAPPEPDAAPAWWMLNKPRGVVSTTKDPEGRPTVMDLVRGALRDRPAPGLAPVGRLDRASAGLLLLTNDHTLAARLLEPRTHVEKTYRVKVRGHPTEVDLQRLGTETLVEEGIALGPMQVEVESRGPKSAWLVVRLCEGKNRQVRRRLEALGHPVETLVRTAFGPLTLGDLAPGVCRPLASAEVEALRRAGMGPGTASR